MQLLLQLRHEEHRDDDRNHMALVTGKINVIETKPHGSSWNRLGSRHGPCVKEVRMDHDHTDNGSQKWIAAENLCRAERN